MKDSVRSISEARFGDHNCAVYNSNQDLNVLLAKYFEYGLDNNQFCIWLTPGADRESDARKTLQNMLPDSKRHLIKNHIEFLDCNDFYLKGGSFKPDLVLEQWVNKLHWATNNGYDGLRVSGDVGWFSEEDWPSLMNYESKLNPVIGPSNMSALCSYPLYKLGTSQILDVIQRHKLAITKRNGEWHMFEPLGDEISPEVRVSKPTIASPDYQTSIGILTPMIYPEKCDGCGLCIEVCQRSVLYLKDNRIAVRQDADCDWCTNCEAICPTGAIACPFEITMA